MQFSSFFPPSLLIAIVLDSCRPTAAAILAASPVKRDWQETDTIECPGRLPLLIPSDFVIPPSLLHLCASRLDYPRNLGCICIGEDTLFCGTSGRPAVQRMVAYCLDHCVCGERTIRVRSRYTTILNYEPLRTPAGDTVVANPIIASSGNRNRPGVKAPVDALTCPTQTCTNVNLGCGASKQACKCYAASMTVNFYHYGYCGPSVVVGHKRDLAQQRRSYYLNATDRFASTAAPGPPPDLGAQLASGLLPSPCNASYISFACADSSDGIVHEPPQNWLGALLPEGAKAPPPVPEEFLRIHGGAEGKLQVVVE